MSKFAGRMSVRLSSGVLMTMRGTFNLKASRISSETQTNQDGSTDRILTPKPNTAEVTFKDDGQDFEALLLADAESVTIIEEHTSVAHYFTGAFFTGDPQANRMTGEVTGLTLNADNYKRDNS
ncbi:phage tail tube protein [Martelella sp. HB161492]|uniref:phage tail tube protein n=1 Tax=Martelella sp. HB161492 TaxID=2720726 RepID=UPI00159168A3|nr:phage tail tube protein [Martelella sp. HB161492]